MKRLSILFALSFVLLSFGLASALDFNVLVDPSFYSGANIPANTPFEIQIQWQNNDAADLLGGNFNQRVYFDGLVTGLTYSGGNVPGGILPGWEDLWGGIWDPNSYYYAFGWDGVGADTMSHSMLSFSGWPAGSAMATKYKIHVAANVANIEESGNVCINNMVDDNLGDYNWLFAVPADYGGPYCFPIFYPADQPPVFVDPPTQLITQHHVAFDATIGLTDPEGDPITGVGASKGTATLVGGNSIHWVYDPPCSEVGTSNSVTLTATSTPPAGAPNSSSIVVDLVVNNLPPVIGGDCGDPIKTVGVNSTTTFNFTATDPNGVADEQNWSATVAPAFDGDFDIVDGVLTINTATGEGDFVFTVTVEDCAGLTSSCEVSIHVVGQLPFGILIEKEEGPDGFGVYQGHHAYVDIIKTDGTEDMLAFDFLIAYDNSALSSMGAIAGSLFQIPGAFEWEYFTYRFGASGNCDGGCPSGLIRVVGIADQNDGPHHPDVVNLPNGTVLFTLDFLVSNDRTLECMFLPISFFWLDCGDNSLAMHYTTAEDPLEVKQAISLDVFGYNGTPGGYLIELGDEFPSYGGAIADCLNFDPQHPEKTPVRFIHFFNGGIDIACADDIDAKGDINLNGVVYEIADAVVFTNYFLYGMAAFTINQEGQIAASDANADGIPLSVADLVYLIRVVVGDALPYPKLSPAAEPVTFGYSGEVITADVELGAAVFVLEGNVPVSLGADAAHMSIKSAFDGQNTRAIIYSFDKGATFSGQILNTTGSIVSVEAAMYDGTPLKTVNLPTAYAIRNYPNPFNPTTTIEMALPVASNWTLSVYNMLGQKVKDFSGYNEAGIQKVTFDASTLASGIYFYKFAANNNEITKKMVLLK